MALRRSRTALGLLLTVTLLGVVRAQGSGSRDHTEQAPNVEVLGAVETRESPAAVPAAIAFVVAAEAMADGRVADALGLVSYPWHEHLPDWTVAFLPPRGELHAVTLPARKRIEIYVRATDSAATLARVLAHELGHAADVQLNDVRDRDRWRRARGVAPDVAWWPGDSERDFATLAGDFAEAFATWQVGSVSESTVAGAPTPEQLRLLAALVS